MYWGPRFFLIGILPASLGLAVCLGDRSARLLTNVAILAVLAMSVWIGADSLVFGSLWAWTCYENYFALEALCHFTPEFSAWWYPVVAKPTLTGLQVFELEYYLAVFAWLAAPVLARIVSQLADWLADHGGEYLNPTRWRW
jgi:hypothetical protein